jgi:hypothetical protein
MNGTTRFALLMAATSLAGAISADNAPGHSVLMQTPKSDGYEHLTSMPEQKSLGDRCVEMAREIESLKGKPQRRAALAARYQQECQLR